METLEAMGFPKAQASAALAEHDGSLERAIEALAARSALASAMREAALRVPSELVSELLDYVTRLAASPTDSRLRVVPIEGQAPLQRAVRAGREVLELAGFGPRSGFLSLPTVDDRIEIAREALDNAARRAAPEKDARARAAETRRQAASVPAEPAQGARLSFELPSGRASRFFDADDTFARVVRFLATLPDTPDDFVDGRTWRVVCGDPPFFWCDAWTLRDDGTRRIFEEKHASQTLKALGLWPSATISFGTSPKPATPPSTHKKLSDIVMRVEARFDDHQPSADKPHYNVAKSVPNVPGLARLLAMGFPESQARTALKRADGDLDQAIRFLL
ncbi:hypothetical protein CTAYLR_003311 [Chrysophaeum taylorii]|uniref:UBA domain-containing protein n=1 Tax=Chrysophaeum taylorii TaxID=2483200 RepID=A0AAD7UH53_9STRA|nr:hypothetical protein CTAYLR_003311 [Chrysophaeum taylorii]